MRNCYPLLSGHFRLTEKSLAFRAWSIMFHVRWFILVIISLTGPLLVLQRIPINWFEFWRFVYLNLPFGRKTLLRILKTTSYLERPFEAATAILFFGTISFLLLSVIEETERKSFIENHLSEDVPLKCFGDIGYRRIHLVLVCLSFACVTATIVGCILLFAFDWNPQSITYINSLAYNYLGTEFLESTHIFYDKIWAGVIVVFGVLALSVRRMFVIYHDGNPIH